MIITDYSVAAGRGKSALLINPPIYDTRYWDRWAQPHGLLRVGRLLKDRGYGTELIDCLAPARGGRLQRTVRGSVDVGDVPMTVYHYGMPLEALGRALSRRERTPDEVFVTSTMTYWWESTRDVIRVIKRVFPKSQVLVGGIYPTLCPEHAEENTGADLVVAGEVEAASNLWTDLSLYPIPPDYAVVTSSRGCPYDCAHCAQRKINGPGVRHRDPEDVVAEIVDKNNRCGIRKFAFYEDNILIDCEEHFERILELLLDTNLKLHLSAPEGFEVRLLYPRLLRRMKAAGFRSIYLPLEAASLDGSTLLDQKCVGIQDFEAAVEHCRAAGYRPGVRQELNAFILYGVPRQPLDVLVETILYAVHRVGNVTPMLYAPVPGSRLYDKYKSYFDEQDLSLRDLNGKLFPFWRMNGINPSDYVDVQRLMYAFHTQLRGRPFDLLGDSLVPGLVRQSVLKWQERAAAERHN